MTIDIINKRKHCGVYSRTIFLYLMVYAITDDVGGHKNENEKIERSEEMRKFWKFIMSGRLSLFILTNIDLKIISSLAPLN